MKSGEYFRRRGNKYNRFLCVVKNRVPTFLKKEKLWLSFVADLRKAA